MKKTPKKMTLTRETLADLTDREARQILGGAEPPLTSNSVKVCCA